MKKILLTTAAFEAAALAVFSGYKAFASRQDMAALLLDENIEALANGEGTPAEVCYVKQYSDGEWASKLPCDERTNSGMIYSCPPSEYWGYYGVKDRCTK